MTEGTADSDNLISIDKFFETTLKVGQILAAEPVPKSKKLMKLSVNVGEKEPRQILAGIAPYYRAQQLIHRKVVVVANLKPAKLMGLESQGMLLAAADEEGSRLDLVYPGDSSAVGMTVR